MEHLLTNNKETSTQDQTFYHLRTPYQFFSKTSSTPAPFLDFQQLFIYDNESNYGGNSYHFLHFNFCFVRLWEENMIYIFLFSE